MGKVRIEIVPWLSEPFGQKGSRRLLFDTELANEMSLRDFLITLGEKYPAVREVIYDYKTGQLYEHVNIVHNDNMLGADASLDQCIKDGDVLMFLPAFVGG